MRFEKGALYAYGYTFINIFPRLKLCAQLDGGDDGFPAIGSQHTNGRIQIQSETLLRASIDPVTGKSADSALKDFITARVGTHIKIRVGISF